MAYELIMDILAELFSRQRGSHVCKSSNEITLQWV